MSGAIWLASYPRSGNTWTRMALYALRHPAEQIDFAKVGSFGAIISGREQIDRALEIDSALLTEDELGDYRREANALIHGEGAPSQLSKVHDAWIKTPSGRPVFDRAFTHATLYLIRDPRDVAVSWARFTASTIDRSIAFLCNHRATLAASGISNGSRVQLRQPMGSWSDHATSWIDQSGLDPLVIRYEDQLADPAGALRRMAAHIGWDAPEEAVAQAVENTRFEALAGKERREGFNEIAPQTERFFHSGKAGSWRSVLTPEQSAKLEREHGPMMERFGYL